MLKLNAILLAGVSYILLVDVQTDGHNLSNLL